MRHLPTPHPPTEGVGFAPAHHGELLQGVFPDAAGVWRRALVTLPMPGHGSCAVFQPSDRHWGIVGTPELIKVRRAALLTLQQLAPAAMRTDEPACRPAKGGRVEIHSDIPPGIGMGSSTSDVTATIRAVADYHGVALPGEAVSRLAVRAECASDSIMIDDRVVLFAHRDGEVLETLGHRLPPLLVVGCDTDPGGQVDTVRFPPAEYTEDEAARFRVLRAALRRAIATSDVALLGQVATASAELNQRFLPKPALAALLALCRSLGGCGVQVAHSGTVAGLIFDPGRSDPARVVAQCRDGLAALGLPVTAVISAAGPGASPRPERAVLAGAGST